MGNKFENKGESSADKRKVLLQKMNKIAEDIFGTLSDPEQIPITEESIKKLDSLNSDWLQYELNDKGDPISWVVVVPTRKDLAKLFIEQKISERKLLEMTDAQEKYDALYLCSVITLPEYRGKGLALKLLTSVIDKNNAKDATIFSWPTTKEGMELIKKLEKKTSLKVFLREK